MAYFIFFKNQDNVEKSLYRIAETQEDLNNLFNLSYYKVIEVSQNDFDDVKYAKKFIVKYNGDNVTYTDYVDPNGETFVTKKQLNDYLNPFKENINAYLKATPNITINRNGNNYLGLLNNVHVSSIIPKDKSDIDSENVNMQYLIGSFENYMLNKYGTALNPLQLP
jgi:hypothetical protein